MEPLTVESLRQAPRAVTNLLSELKIRCQFFDRGCGQFVELGDLERHVTDCGFAPAVCSNEGCQVEVNKHDLLYHEIAVCELRRVKCHNCKEIRQEMDTVKVNLAAMNEKLKGVGEQLARNEKKVHGNEKNVKTKEMKRSLNEIIKQLERMTQQTSHEVQAEEMKKGIAEGGVDSQPNVIIAGGYSENVKFSGNVQSPKCNLDTTTANERESPECIVSCLQQPNFCHGWL
jgi:predicted transcriptional regulator